MNALKNALRWLRHKFFAPLAKLIIDQLSQGADPHRLALCCSIGAIFGCFPLFGFTTMICLVVGTILKLNQPVLQAVNYLMAPFQLMLIPIFGYLGTFLGSREQSASVSLNPVEIAKSFHSDPGNFLHVYGWLGLHAVMVWAACAPFAGYLIYRVSLASFSRVRDLRRNV